MIDTRAGEPLLASLPCLPPAVVRLFMLCNTIDIAISIVYLLAATRKLQLSSLQRMVLCCTKTSTMMPSLTATKQSCQSFDEMSRFCASFTVPCFLSHFAAVSRHRPLPLWVQCLTSTSPRSAYFTCQYCIHDLLFHARLGCHTHFSTIYKALRRVSAYQDVRVRAYAEKDQVDPKRIPQSWLSFCLSAAMPDGHARCDGTLHAISRVCQRYNNRRTNEDSSPTFVCCFGPGVSSDSMRMCYTKINDASSR